MTKKRTRYAICGLSTRGIYHFVLPLIGKAANGGNDFSDCAELVGILDLDSRRVEVFLEKVGVKIPFYQPQELGRMLKETKPDVLIAVGPDGTHADHAIAGLEAGCDVIVEKPMAINCDQVRALQAAEKRSGHRVLVAFNYRYVPTHLRLKRMIQEGKLGRIVNVEFTYNLDTWHGSSYFYRWNRGRDGLSGGLNIHKCCHHFDLINWFLGDAPAEVFAFGGLNYYGPNGALRPRDADGRPLSPAEEKRRCPVFQKHYADRLAPESNEINTGWDTFRLPMDAQYPPDKRRYIYDDSIVIEDTYNAVVRYARGATMSYSCNFCTPWEGYVLGINGTAGRVEISHRTDPDPTGKTSPVPDIGRIVFYPLFGGKEVIEVPPVAGGHGGADSRIQNDLVKGPSPESRELKLVAGSFDGAQAVAIGEAVARSIRTHQSVSITDLLAGRA
ncbi:MAG: Gfo/Idh/MocA family oxidoreductase [Kiritimatiellae bacterium]|nr:Gfo/Idh/MocA family oxidoreductase [Kiritimatiellia bacterium]